MSVRADFQREVIGEMTVDSSGPMPQDVSRPYHSLDGGMGHRAADRGGSDDFGKRLRTGGHKIDREWLRSLLTEALALRDTGSGGSGPQGFDP